MRYAIISDIHGNSDALETALSSIARRKAERIICLGDVVGYGASPNECIKLIREAAEVGLMGNHDSAVIGTTSIESFTRRAQISTEWTRDQLTEEGSQYIESLSMQWNHSGILAVHASPCEPENWTYILDSHSAGEAFRCFDEAICFIGHSHVPIRFLDDGTAGVALREETIRLDPETRSIVNVGSVGQPRDGDPRLSFAIFDSDRGTVQICREEYDIATASRKIIDAGLPEELGKRLFFGM